jgi:uncharacterized protein YecT (DUF1311 family)
MNPRLHLTLAFLLALFACGPMTLRAGDKEENKIDRWLTAALEKNTSTAGMRKALNEAREMWDGEMNATYQRLQKLLTKDQQKVLRESQRCWLAFRDADNRAIEDLIASRSGTMNQLTATDLGMQRVRDRALQLAAYEHELKGE